MPLLLPRCPSVHVNNAHAGLSGISTPGHGPYPAFDRPPSAMHQNTVWGTRTTVRVPHTVGDVSVARAERSVRRPPRGRRTAQSVDRLTRDRRGLPTREEPTASGGEHGQADKDDQQVDRWRVGHAFAELTAEEGADREVR